MKTKQLNGVKTSCNTSPTALRFLKAAMNADTDGLAGLQQMAGDATLLYYTTDEAKEGRDAFKENVILILTNSLNSHKQYVE